jgi:hypothetical protein
MRTRLPALLAMPGLLLAGCLGATAKIQSEDINGVNARKATNAVFGLVEAAPVDINADGADDFAASLLIVVASDEEPGALCTRLSDPANLDADPTNDLLPTHLTEAFALALRLEPVGAGTPFTPGEVVVGDPLNSLPPILIVDGGFRVREGGVDIANTTGEGDGSFELTALGADLFEGVLRASLTTDLSSGAEVSVGQIALTASFQGAQNCPALNAL